jgi:hypothetical protein
MKIVYVYSVIKNNGENENQQYCSVLKYRVYVYSVIKNIGKGSVNFSFLLVRKPHKHKLYTSPVAFTFLNVLVLNIAEILLAGR